MFQTLFYQPVLNLLVYIYNIVPGHDIGMAIIVLTIVIKVVLWPLSGKALKSQKALQSLQPKIEDLKAQYKDDKEGMSRAMMALYKTEKINPFSSCLPLLIQLPFFWAVFKVFRNELTNEHLNLVYSFIHNPGALSSVAFGIVNLSEPNMILAILAGVAQFAQAKMMPKQQPSKAGSKEASMANIMSKQMTYFMPVLTVFICMGLPSGLALYWFLTTILTIAQQLWIFRKGQQDTGSGQKVIEGETVL